MRVRLLAVVLIGAVAAGCLPMSRTTFVTFDPLGHDEAGGRSGPAEFTRAADDSLLSAGYAMIGTIKAEQVCVRCFDEETVICDTVCTVDEHLSALLEEAGSRGGDFVTLGTKARRTARPTVKMGECLNWKTETTQRVIGSRMETTTERTCTNYEWIHGTEVSLESSGSVWRLEPELARAQADGCRLADAARLGDVSRLREILDAGVEVDARGSDGATALCTAVAFNREETARLLLDRGASADAFGRYGTALHMAADAGHAGMVELLLSHGADAEARLKDIGDVLDGGTPLHSAARGGSGDVVRVLLDAGADIEARTDDKMTPLMIAAAYGGGRGAMDALLDAHASTEADCGDYYFAGGVLSKADALELAVLHWNAEAIISFLEHDVNPTDLLWSSSFWKTFSATQPEQIYQLIQGYQSGVYGYVDRSGELVIPLGLVYAGSFDEELAAARRGYYHGYVDKAGRFAIYPQFESAGGFSEGLSGVSTDDKWGYIDREGEFVIAPLFGFADGFTEGLAPVNFETDPEKNYWGYYKYGYIDANAAVVIEPQYKMALRFSEGRAIVGRGYGKGMWFVDRSGERVGDETYLNARSFSEGLAPVCRECSSKPYWVCGYLDSDGEIAIDHQFALAEPFSEGLAAVMIEREGEAAWGFIDQSGEFVIGPHAEWHSAEGFSDGLAMIAVTDRANEFVVDALGRGMSHCDDAEIPKRGYIDHAGEFVIEPRFVYASSFSEGLAGASVPDPEGYGSLYGFIDKTGRFMIEPAYDDVGAFSEGMAWVKKDDKEWWLSEWSRTLGAPMLAVRLSQSLMTAATLGNIDAVMKCIEEGADVDHADPEGTTSLMAAVLAGNGEIVRLLLDHSADPNIQDSNGYTALIYAAGSGDLPFVRMLLDAGADVRIGTGETGMTALSFAELNGHAEVVALLEDHGAR